MDAKKQGAAKDKQIELFLDKRSFGFKSGFLGYFDAKSLKENYRITLRHFLKQLTFNNVFVKKILNVFVNFES